MTTTRQDSAFVALESYLAKTVRIGQAMTYLEWDIETHMPAGAASQRGEQVAALTEVRHARWVSSELGDLLEQAESSGLDERRQAVIREAKIERNRAVKVPVELSAEIARTKPVAGKTWENAKASADFGVFRPMLATMVELRRQEADALAEGGDRYDALLADYEPGMTGARIEGLFSGLRSGLVEILGHVRDSAANLPDISGRFRDDLQMKLARELASTFGYDWNRGRLDTSSHPFCCGSHNDVRITTRRKETDPLECLYATIHETGHALYEQGVDPALGSTVLGQGASMGIHESQSRILENQIGRSRGFCRHLFSRMCAVLGSAGVGSPEELYRAVNKVRRGFIRTEADEVQYNLHIMLRFDLERALVGGDLEVDDLEGAWNDRFAADFGFEVDNAANGVLQDAHWSHGLFGYFPTYTLGNIYSGELVDALFSDVPDLEDRLASGDTDALVAWLRHRIHRHGRQIEPSRLIAQAVGHSPTAEPLLRYLNAKFGELYGF